MVYNNDFSSQGEFRDIVRTGGGKRCDKKYREKSKVMLASVKSSPTTCSFRPPVQGDDELANQGVAVRGQDPQDDAEGGARAARSSRSTVRAGGGGTGYSFRIFPQRKRFELDRGPAGGGFPASGKSDAIKKVNERNRIQIVATGAQLRALVNGKRGGERRRLQPGAGQGPQGALRARLPGQEEEQEGHRHLQARLGLGPQPVASLQGLRDLDRDASSARAAPAPDPGSAATGG